MKTNPDDLINQIPKLSEDIDSDATICISGGLTKREYFAAMALQGLLSADSCWSTSSYTIRSVEIADALIEELNRKK